MNEYLTLFSSHTAYESAVDTLKKPNVSYCQQEDEVHYNPLEPAVLTVVYNHTDASEPLDLIMLYEGSGDSGTPDYNLEWVEDEFTLNGVKNNISDLEILEVIE